MSDAISVHQKKRRGRPSEGGRDPLVSARIPQKEVDILHRWAEENGVTRSEAIRRLIQKGLEAAGSQQ